MRLNIIIAAALPGRVKAGAEDYATGLIARTQTHSLEIQMKNVIETVEIRVGSSGYKFPEKFKTVEHDRKDDAGKDIKVSYWSIDVEYVDPETVDDLCDDKFIEQAMLAMDTTEEKDYVKACKAGIRLAIGDAAKAPFREKGGQKNLVAATTWAAMNDDQSFMDAWRAGLKADKDAANKALISAYLANK